MPTVHLELENKINASECNEYVWKKTGTCTWMTGEIAKNLLLAQLYSSCGRINQRRWDKIVCTILFFFCRVAQNKLLQNYHDKQKLIPSWSPSNNQQGSGGGQFSVLNWLRNAITNLKVT